MAVINVNRFRKINTAANARISQLDVLSEQLKTMENVGAVDATTVVQSNRIIYSLYTQKAELEENLKTSEVNFAKLFGLTPNAGLQDLSIGSFNSSNLDKELLIEIYNLKLFYFQEVIFRLQNFVFIELFPVMTNFGGFDDIPYDLLK